MVRFNILPLEQISHLTDHFPGLQIQWDELENNEVIERLCDNTLDVGLWLVLVLIKNSHLFLFIQVR